MTAAEQLRDQAIAAAKPWLESLAPLLPPDVRLEDLAIKLAAEVAKPAIELVEQQAAQIEAVLKLHKPWYESGGVQHEHVLQVGWGDAPKGHVCRIGFTPDYDNCDREDETHAVLACVECRGATDEGEPGYLFWPCSTARALGVTS